MSKIIPVTMNDEQMDKFLEQPRNLLQIFMSSFVEDNGYKHENVKATLGNNATTQTAWKGKVWTKRSLNQAMIGVHSDDFSIIFGEVSTSCIEIYMLEAKERCKGVGTRVMNEVLDLADKMGINVVCVPTAYKNLNDDKYLEFLREWYLSFGFKASNLSPTMIYKS